MKSEKQEAQDRADRLHAEEEREKARAAKLPDGGERDRHQMHGERLADQAWSLEEANDLDPKPSGLWSNS